MRLRLNQPNVISESIDGEAVIIALDTGTYYSARGPSARAWDALVAGHDPAAVADELRHSYDAAAADVEAEVAAFVAELQEHKLLVLSDDGATPDALPALEGVPPWEPLVLETFTDMQDLILLDPVHEVEPTEGWPTAPNAG